jgi:1,4-dihydroxy-2-naphthoate octaprenyltransferase
VQALDINWAVIIAGLAPGFLSMAILSVNNLRDLDTDRRAGKMTLAVRYGRSFAMSEYLFCILAAGFTPLWVNLVTQDHEGIVFSSVVAFFAIPSIKTVFTQTEGPKLNAVLVTTGQLLLIYSVVYSFGWILCSR